MKAYRTVFALLILAALLIPQAMPVQSAPDSANKTVNLQPGDMVTINCPTRLTRISASNTKWELRCRFATAASTATSLNAKKTVDLQPGDRATINCPTRLIQKSGLAVKWELLCRPLVATTATPVATILPTQTPQATVTPGTGGLIQPFKSAPACPTHDETEWHGLWDYKRGCHYDHTHGDDPTLADTYFGSAGMLWGGQDISYPFATSEMENMMKHGGYKYSVKTPNYHAWPACGINAHADNSQNGNNCIKASRVQYHVVGGTLDTMARVHSYYMELLVCKYPAYTECGIIKIGGHADFAQLQAPHYNNRVVRPGGMIDFGDGVMMNFDADGSDLPAKSGEPYVFAIPYSPEELTRRRANPPTVPDATMDQWSMNDLDCEPRPAGSACRNQYARFMTQVGDAWNLIDTQNPNNVRWICKGEPGCAYNGSMIGVNELALHILQEWQSGGNGFVTMTGYTDRWGNPRFDNVCKSVGVDCVPLVLDHVPTGYAATRTNVACECVVYEYDTYFNGKPSDWIQFPD